MAGGGPPAGQAPLAAQALAAGPVARPEAAGQAPPEVVGLMQPPEVVGPMQPPAAVGTGEPPAAGQAYRPVPQALARRVAACSAPAAAGRRCLGRCRSPCTTGGTRSGATGIG